MSENRLTAALFGDPETEASLTDRAELAAMIRFEAALAQAEAAQGVIPEDAGPAIAGALEGYAPDPQSLVAATASARVPVPALVTMLRAQVGAPHGSYVHWGATSQDVVDTGTILRLRQILSLHEGRLRTLVGSLCGQAETFAALPMAGRTRTQLATPVTFGLRIASWLSPMARCLERLNQIRPRLLKVQLGGAAGTGSVFGDKGPAVAADLAHRLDLHCPVKPWHTERDTLFELGAWLAMVAGLLGRMGADLAILARSEIGEVHAGVAGGSSTMPQKANPVGAEALVTLARSTGGHLATLTEALIHPEERDGVSWALEWIALPPLLTATGAGLRHALELADSLRPDPEVMARNMRIGGGTIHAEALAFALAAHMPLDEAQALVKAAAQEPGEDDLSVRVERQAKQRGIPFEVPGQTGELQSADAMVRAAVTDARRVLADQTPR